jgi:hypothetical protein
MNECKSCLHYRTQTIAYRHAEFCSRNGSSIAFERDLLGSCGEEGRFFVSTALPSVESQRGKFA